MNFIKKYTKFNNHFIEQLKNYILYCMQNPTLERERFLSCINGGSIDLEGTVDKLLIDDYELVNLDGKEFELLPMGLINANIPRNILSENPEDKHYSGNTYNRVFLDSPRYEIFYYPDDKIRLSEDKMHSFFFQICESYIKHYRDNLGEEWSPKSFFELIKSLQYLSIKFARDPKTKEIFVIGFFGASVRMGAEGKTLTNAELYVMDQFRGLGIASKMVGLTFAKAEMDGILDFDSITYRTPNMNALGFWNKIGANVSNLYHIEGSIPLMIDRIEKSKTYR